MRYIVNHAVHPPALDADFDGPAWADAPPLQIARFYPQGSAHRPAARARVLYDHHALHLAFHVRDRWVRCVQAGYDAPVCRDSCVEFFVQPVVGRGYFNLELSCGGHLLLHYNELDGDDIRRVPLPPGECARVAIAHSLPERVDPEIETPLDWQVACSVPLDLFAPWVGPLHPRPGTAWRANFYKCGDETSHPHWGMWAPVSGRLSFHQPAFFGELGFA